MARTVGTCEKTEKDIFPNDFEARLALSRAKKERIKGNKRRKECRYYYCAYCDGYHLTSRPKSAAEKFNNGNGEK